jgi:AcrR family transcriptional regulator
MARPKNTPEKIERMRNAMMDAVISLLDEVPPDKVSIRMIAEKVGVSHMVFYTYFKDRDEIMDVLVERERKSINEHFSTKLEEAEKVSVKTVLEELIQEYTQTAREHPKIFRLYWLDPMDGSGSSVEKFSQLDESIDSLSKILKVGIEKGEIKQKNPRLAASTTMAIMNGPIIMEQCRKMPKDINCDDLLAEIKKAVFAYLEA